MNFRSSWLSGTFRPFRKLLSLTWVLYYSLHRSEFINVVQTWSPFSIPWCRNRRLRACRQSVGCFSLRWSSWEGLMPCCWCALGIGADPWDFEISMDKVPVRPSYIGTAWVGKPGRPRFTCTQTSWVELFNFPSFPLNGNDNSFSFRLKEKKMRCAKSGAQGGWPSSFFLLGGCWLLFVEMFYWKKNQKANYGAGRGKSNQQVGGWSPEERGRS